MSIREHNIWAKGIVHAGRVQQERASKNWRRPEEERAERIIKPKRQKWNEMEKELKLKKGFLLYILSFSTLLHNDPAALQDQNFSLTWFSAGLWAEQWIALLIVQNLLLFIALQLSRRGWPRGRQQRTEVSLQYTQETGINETRRMEFFLIFFTICFVFICLF